MKVANAMKGIYKYGFICIFHVFSVPLEFPTLPVPTDPRTLICIRWNFLAWCLVIFLRAKKPVHSSARIMATMMKFTALSRGSRIRSSLRNRKLCRGNCSRMVRSQKPASSGTWRAKFFTLWLLLLVV